MQKAKFVFLMMYLLASSIAFCQEFPPISIFSTDDYDAENQNWGISQAPNKFIYVANNKGLLEYNGEEWSLYPTPNETIMRSVKCYQELVFTGFYMDFGYWKKNSFGKLDYTSLVNSDSFSMLEDEQIWEIEELNGWIIFKSLQRIFLYNLSTSEIQIFSSENNIIKLTKLDNTIYFQEIGKGIFSLEGGKAKLVSDNPILKENLIVNIFKIENNLLFLTQKNGFYILENNQVKKWNITANSILEGKTVYSASQLSNQDILLGTISNGLISLKNDGNFNYQINSKKGLSNNTILSIFTDVDNNIWLGLDNGVNVIDSTSPFQIYQSENGLSGTVYASIVFENNLYLGTNQGLFYRKQNSDDDFKLIQNTQGQVWNLSEINGTLFCSHDSGTFTIQNDKAAFIENTIGTWNVKKIDEETVLQGSYNGLSVLKKVGNSWEFRNKVKGFNNSSRIFLLVDENTVFVNHEYKGVYKLQINSDYTEATNVIRDNSVDKSITSHLLNYNGDILYTSKKGVYKYHFDDKKFKKDTLLSDLLSTREFLSAKLIYDKENNRLWSFTKTDVRYLAPNTFNSEPILTKIPVKGNLFKGASGYENILYLGNDKYLVGTSNGFFILYLDKITQVEDFKTHLTKVYNFKLDEKKQLISLEQNKTFKNDQNNIEFFFSVPSFNKTSIINYQYKLEGFNEKWSEKTDQNNILFKNLPFGDYTFKVKSFIDEKQSSNTLAYSFSISKPWYLSNLFVVIYVTGTMVVLYLFHITYRRYYRKQREKLIEKSNRENELKELENKQKITKLNNEKLRSDIESKNRELATSTMSIIKKNEFLNTIKTELLTNGKESIKKVVKIIDKNLNNTDDWKLFQEAFNNADKNFLKKVKDKHPNLTPNDLRLCAYLRLNLSSKEIAPLLNISPRSVEVKRYRLRKKMDLDHNDNLTDYILNI